MPWLAAIGANLFLLVAAWGYGQLLGRLFPQSFSLLDRAAFTLLGGLGLTGTLLFIVGQVWFSKTAIFLILLPGIMLGLKALPSLVREVSGKQILDSKCAIPVAIVVTVFAITAVGGLAEPVGDIRMDAIAYHFLGPEVWIRHGAIQPVIDEAYTAFPAIVEVQYAAVLAFGGARALSFFAVISLVSVLLMSASLARRCGLDPRLAWWAIALISSMPALYRGVYGGFVDAIYSAMVLAIARKICCPAFFVDLLSGRNIQA
jgi:hypothetical protein